MVKEIQKVKRLSDIKEHLMKQGKILVYDFTVQQFKGVSTVQPVEGLRLCRSSNEHLSSNETAVFLAPLELST